MAVVSQIMTTDGSLHTISASETTYTNYGVCETSADASAKVVTVNNSNFSLLMGVKVHVKFSNVNYATSPTLAVNGTQAKPIVVAGNIAVGRGHELSWNENGVAELVYDGTNWVLSSWENDSDVYYALGDNITIQDINKFEYTQLESVYNNANTTFSTGIVPTNQNEVLIDIRYKECVSYNNFSLLCYGNGANPRNRYGVTLASNGLSVSKITFSWREKGDTYLMSTIERVANHVYHIKASLHEGKAILYVFDETTGMSNEVSTTYDPANTNALSSSNYLRIFSLTSSAGYSTQGTHVYHARLDCNGKTMLNYIPMLRKSDNAVGFFNTVSNSFRSSSNLNAGYVTDRNIHFISVSSTVDDSNFVHKTENETIAGEKTFQDNIIVSNGAEINFDLGNDEGLYMQATLDQTNKIVSFGDLDDDSEIRVENIADPVNPADAVNLRTMQAAIAGGSSGITLPLAIEDGGTGGSTAKGAEYRLTPNLATNSTTAIADTSRIPFVRSSPSASNGRFSGYKTALLFWNYIYEKITSLLGISYASNSEGVPLAPTAANGTNTTQIATTAFVQNAKNEITNKMVVLDGRSGQYGIHQKSLCASASINNDAAYRMTSFTTTSGTHTSKSSDVGASFPIGCNIYYHPDDTDFNGNTEFVAKKFYSSYDSVDARYTAIEGYNVSLSSGVSSNVYLKVVIIYGGTRWAPYYNKDSAYEIIATSDDLEADNFYIYLGKVSSSNAYSFQLEENNPLYYYDGTRLVNWATYIAESRITTYTAGDGISINNGVIAVDADDELDPDATTPVQNWVVTSAIEDIESTIIFMGRVWHKTIGSPPAISQYTLVSISPSSGSALTLKGLYKISATFGLKTGNTGTFATEANVALEAILNGSSSRTTLYKARVPVGVNTPGTCHLEAFVYLTSGTLIPSLSIEPIGGYVFLGDHTYGAGSYISAEYIGSNNYISA